MQQTTLHVEGRDIRIDAFEPAGTNGSHPAIVLLHGAGGNVGYWLNQLAPHLTATGVALYAPHYFDRTGTVRADLRTISDGIHVPQWLATTDAVLRYAAARPNVDAARIAVLGILLGSFLALSLAAQLSASENASDQRRIRAIVDVSGGLVEPYQSQATKHFPPTLILHGDRDDIVAVSHAQRLDALLTRLQVSHSTHILAGEGHWFTSAAQTKLLLQVAGFLSRELL